MATIIPSPPPRPNIDFLKWCENYKKNNCKDVYCTLSHFSSPNTCIDPSKGNRYDLSLLYHSGHNLTKTWRRTHNWPYHTTCECRTCNNILSPSEMEAERKEWRDARRIYENEQTKIWNEFRDYEHKYRQEIENEKQRIAIEENNAKQDTIYYSCGRRSYSLPFYIQKEIKNHFFSLGICKLIRDYCCIPEAPIGNFDRYCSSAYKYDQCGCCKSSSPKGSVPPQVGSTRYILNIASHQDVLKYSAIVMTKGIAFLIQKPNLKCVGITLNPNPNQETEEYNLTHYRKINENIIVLSLIKEFDDVICPYFKANERNTLKIVQEAKDVRAVFTAHYGGDSLRCRNCQRIMSRCTLCNKYERYVSTSRLDNVKYIFCRADENKCIDYFIGDRSFAVIDTIDIYKATKYCVC